MEGKNAKYYGNKKNREGKDYEREIEELIEAGKKYIEVENYRDWEIEVRKRAKNSLFIIEQAIKIMKNLDEIEDENDFLKLIYKIKKGLFSADLLEIVLKFSKKKDKLNNLEEMIKSNATEIKLSEQLHFEDIVKNLEDNRRKGNNVYVVMSSGKKLYSLLDDENSCYLKVFNKTKEQMRLLLMEEKLNKEKLKKERIEKIPEFILLGEKYIYPQMKEEWQNCVRSVVDSFNHGDEIVRALEIMQILDSTQGIEGCIKAEEIFTLNKDLSDATQWLVAIIVLDFSKRGPEFYRYFCEKELGNRKQFLEDQLERAASVEKQNSQFEEELKDQKD